MLPARPIPRHYLRLLGDSGDGEHPADTIIESLPEIVDADSTAAVLMHAAIEASALSAEQWTVVEDARLAQRCLREERFFDLGYELGRIVGAAAARANTASDGALSLRGELEQLMLRSSAAPRVAVDGLLAMAQAILLAEDSLDRGRGHA